MIVSLFWIDFVIIVYRFVFFEYSTSHLTALLLSFMVRLQASQKIVVG